MWTFDLGMCACSWVYVCEHELARNWEKQSKDVLEILQLRGQCVELSVRDVTYINGYIRHFLWKFPLWISQNIWEISFEFLWEGFIIIDEIYIWSLFLSHFHFISWTGFATLQLRLYSLENLLLFRVSQQIFLFGNMLYTIPKMSILSCWQLSDKGKMI